MTPLFYALESVARLRIYPEIDELLSTHPTYQKLIDQGVEAIAPEDGHAFFRFAANDLINCVNRLPSYNNSDAISNTLHDALFPIHLIEYLNGNTYCLRLYIVPLSTHPLKQQYTRINTYGIIHGDTPQRLTFMLHHANIRYIRILVNEHPPTHIITTNHAHPATTNPLIWAQNGSIYIDAPTNTAHHEAITSHLTEKDSPIFHDNFTANQPYKILHQYDWIMSIT